MQAWNSICWEKYGISSSCITFLIWCIAGTKTFCYSRGTGYCNGSFRMAHSDRFSTGVFIELEKTCWTYVFASQNYPQITSTPEWPGFFDLVQVWDGTCSFHIVSIVGCPWLSASCYCNILDREPSDNHSLLMEILSAQKEGPVPEHC